MATNQTMTSFMGSEIGDVDERVTKALNASTPKLSIHQFIAATEFKIDPIMVNYFWQVVAKNCSTHMGTTMLNFIGYDTSDKKNKQNFTKFLKRQNIPYEELLHTDDRCKLYDDILEEQRTMHLKDLVKRKWLLMNSRDFKRAIMGLRTKRADAIKDYYFNLEELVQLYCDYDKRFEVYKREAEINRRGDKIDELISSMNEMRLENKRSMDELLRKNDELLSKNDALLDINHDQLDQLNALTTQNNDLQEDVTAIGRKLNVACVDRAPRPLRVQKRERFLLLKWTNVNYHKTLDDPRPEDDHRRFRYYAIRAQAIGATTALRTQRQKDAALEIVLELDVQPNTKTLYNRIKDELVERGVVFIRNAISLTDTTLTETDLVERMREVDDDKFSV